MTNNLREIHLENLGDKENTNLDLVLENNEILDIKQQCIKILEDIESRENGIIFKKETIDALFIKYPSLSIEEFKGYFLSGTYNKNLLQCSEEIVDFIDLDSLSIGEDIVGHVIKKISLSKEDFDNNISGKFDVLTFPNLAKGDVAQGYFYEKISKIFDGTNIIFGDMKEIRDEFGNNQFNCDSSGFIDLMGTGYYNTCLLKLLKTEPDYEKVNELNKIFSDIDKDILIGGSTYNLPFEVPSNFQGVSLPKTERNEKSPLLMNKSILINSMGYLNSAFYADKVKSSFVYGSHNIAEPIHAGNLTVIVDEIKNKYNHNWLISYFGEKANLIFYMNSDNTENKESVNDFLNISSEEIIKRNTHFQDLVEKEIKPLIYGITYNFLKKNFNGIIE